MFSTNQDAALFDIDIEEIEATRKLIGASEQQMLAAYNRAITRTAVTIKKQTKQNIGPSIGFKNQKVLKKRLQQFRLRSTNKLTKLDSLKLWFGLDPIAVGHVKGKIKRLGTKKNPKGAIFNPKGAGVESDRFKNGFISKRYKRRSIFTRVGEKSFPIKEARVKMSEKIKTSIEDDVWQDLPDIFMHHFEQDLKSRKKMGLNETGWK